MIRQYSVCTNAHTECLNPCSTLKTTEERKFCFADCGKAKDLCTDKAVADYKTCVEASRQSAPISRPSPTIEPTISQDNKSIDNETVCHESCQSDYDECTYICKSSDVSSNSNSGEYASQTARDKCFDTLHTCSTVIYSRSGCEWGACADEVEQTCDNAYVVCLQSANNTVNTTGSTFDSCFSACNKTKSTCDQKCRETGQTTNNTKPVENTSVGVSSRDFRALAQANAEYQKAQADLEKIKADNDPRWEAKKDFSEQYNAVFKGNEKLKDDLVVLRGDLETIHELATKYKDFSEIEETIDSIKTGEIGDYGKMDLFTDAVKSFNDYHDLRSSGISAKDATTKATLDNFGTSALTLIPVLKAIDLVATTPDFILEIFGVDEKNWSRKYVTEGVIGKFAPSGVVEQTTDLMIEDGWADIGNALKFGWDKMIASESVGAKAWESGKLLAGTLGAIPVAIAQGVSDVVGGGISVGEKAADFVWSWFTYPN